MPTYDYKCSACGTVREVIQKMTDAPLTQCPECGGEFRRIITSVGIIFKGSGFHINDYRGNGSAKDASADKDKSAADKAGDKPADSKESTQPAASESKLAGDK